MNSFTDVKEWQLLRRQLAEKSIGFVPTMGALHEGHVSLIKKSKSENQITVASIFVNPTQFDNPEDLKKYPSRLARDLELLQAAGADYVITPNYESMYPDHFRFQVTEKELSQILCGQNRPGHFTGVLTVVMKLFNLVKPTRAYFGEKDYQQLKLIEGMVEAFFMDIEIVPCPIVRETDGLAKSSRNVRLSPEARRKANVLYNVLASSTDPRKAGEELKSQGFDVDYVEIRFGRRFGAARIDNVRLIDNVPIT